MFIDPDVFCHLHCTLFSDMRTYISKSKDQQSRKKLKRSREFEKVKMIKRVGESQNDQQIRKSINLSTESEKSTDQQRQKKSKD